MLVTYENRLDFVAAAVDFRLHEFDSAARAMRRGLVALVSHPHRRTRSHSCTRRHTLSSAFRASAWPVQVPERALRLLTWRELENMACGDPVIDLELLKKHTSYVGAWDKSHEAVRVPCAPMPPLATTTVVTVGGDRLRRCRSSGSGA